MCGSEVLRGGALFVVRGCDHLMERCGVTPRVAGGEGQPAEVVFTSANQETYCTSQSPRRCVFMV